MNTSYKNIFILFIAVFMSGCSKEFLDRNNPTATTDDKWWKLEADLRGYLDIVYNNCLSPGALTTTTSYQANCLSHMDGTTDEMVFRANFGSWQDFATGAVTVSNAYLLDLYRQNYRDIRNASRILENYKRVYIEDNNLKERYAAEAMALRAYAHLKLFRFFGPVPIITASATIEEAYSIPRNTEAEVVDFISTQLDTAALVLPTSYTYSSADAYRITKGACYAMQVQLYLGIKNYDKVIEYAKKLIDLNVYNLYYSQNPAVNSYVDLFGYNALANNKENILIRFGGNPQAFFRLAPKSLGGQAANSPTASMVNTYETLQGKTLQELGNDSLMIYWKNPLYKNNRDPRMFASILFPGQTFINRVLNPFATTGTDALGLVQSTQTGFWVKKYVDPADVSKPQAGTLNFMIIRYAEILLSYVEALVESGDWQNPDVKLYLNKIRNRAGMPNFNETVYNSQDKLRELYRRERMVELAFEGTRLFDIRRWKIGEIVMNGPAQGAINPATNAPVTVETRVFNPARDYLWPIPLGELNTNSAMTQNPNW